MVKLDMQISWDAGGQSLSRHFAGNTLTPHFPTTCETIEPKLREAEGRGGRRNSQPKCKKRKQNHGLSEVKGPWRPSRTRLSFFIDEETGLGT